MKTNLHYQSIPAQKPQPTRSDFAKAMGYCLIMFILFLIPFICGFVDYLLNLLK